MPAFVRRSLAAATLSLLLPALAWCQSAPDPGFDTSISRPAFTKSHPVLLFDSAHHNLFTAGDRYAPLASMAKHDGFDIRESREAVTPATLSEANVFLIADPLGSADPMSHAAEGPAFLRTECDAIVHWVKGGGGLLLIAEHAPSGYAARGLAVMLGVDLSAGFLSDSALQDSTIGGSTLVFSRATGTVGDHPTTRGRDTTERVQRVRTFTGESLKGPEGSVTLLRLSDYATDNMIRAGHKPGPIPDSLVHTAKGRAQGIAFTLGKGRVVVLGEGAMLTAQVMKHGDDIQYRMGMSVRDADNRQFALNVLRWLGGGLN
jgi:hypothetical protein